MKIRDRQLTTEELEGETKVGEQYLHCTFALTKLHFTSFKDCIFQDCDFTGIMLDQTSFESCTFPGSKLSNLDFAGTRLIKCNFEAALVDQTYFRGNISDHSKKPYDLRTCNFANTSLENAIFAHCDLKGVSFANSKLNGATFENCLLHKADFAESSLEGTRWEGCTIEGTTLSLSGFLSYGISHGFKLDATG
jgi:uncharacterized protein YjbI with pentapeptide repeats